jgi:hypothetical protein
VELTGRCDISSSGDSNAGHGGPFLIRVGVRTLMDKDKNRVVSKEEFLQFISSEFDRLDVNRNEQLERREMMRAMCRGGRGPLFCHIFPQ